MLSEALQTPTLFFSTSELHLHWGSPTTGGCWDRRPVHPQQDPDLNGTFVVFPWSRVSLNTMFKDVGWLWRSAPHNLPSLNWETSSNRDVHTTTWRSGVEVARTTSGNKRAEEFARWLAACNRKMKNGRRVKERSLRSAFVGKLQKKSFSEEGENPRLKSWSGN